MEDCLEIGPWLEVEERRLDIDTGMGMRLGPAAKDFHTESDNSFISVKDGRVGIGRCCICGPALSVLGDVTSLRCSDSDVPGAPSHE
jgi:hypothetical protein